MSPMHQAGRQRLLILCIVLTPIVTIMMLSILLEADYSNYSPFRSDEVRYWRQAADFAAAGLDNGYHGVNERIPIASFARYHAWGLFNPIFYGTFFRLFGTSLIAIPVINLVIYTLSVALFVWATKPTTRQGIYLIALLATFVPFLLYSLTSMSQLLLQAIAINMATGFYLLIKESHRHKTASATFLFVIILLSGIMQITWAIFYIPFFLLIRPKQPLVGLAISLGLIGLTTVSYTMTSAPFPNFFSQIVQNLLSGDIGTATTLFITHVSDNLGRLFSDGNVGFIQRVQVALVLGFVVRDLWYWWRKRNKSQLSVADIQLQALILYGLGGIVLLNIFLYDIGDFRDYRLLAPLLLMALLFYVARQQFKLLRLVIMTMIISLIGIIDDLPSRLDPNFDPQRPQLISQLAQELDGVVTYLSDAPTPWCNTITGSVDYNFEDNEVILALEPGIGPSLAFPRTASIEQPAKARYLLLTDDDYDTWPDRQQLTLLLNVPSGAIYLNPNSVCDVPYALADDG